MLVSVASEKVVVFIPGIGGSNLYTTDTNDKVYLRFNFLMDLLSSSTEAKFRDPKQSLNSTSMIGDHEISVVGNPGYDGTIQFFASSGWSIRRKSSNWIKNFGEPPTNNIFFEYPYDWRIDIRDISSNLNDFIKNRVLNEFPDVDIYLVTHSTGGLVSRAYLSGLYPSNNPLQPSPKVKAQILIATPSHGAPKAYRVLRTGKGFAENKGWKSGLPRHIKDRAVNLPLVYQLLPDEQYEKYFNSYYPIVKFLDKAETLRGSYISSESTIFTGDPTKALDYYSLDNDDLVKGALDFHNDLGRKTYLPNNTYAIYTEDMETPMGIRYTLVNSPGDIGTTQFAYVGDGTVPARSVYDLEGLSDDGGLNPNPYQPPDDRSNPNQSYPPDNNFDPSKDYLIQMSQISHTGLPAHSGVLSYVLQIINSL